MIEFKNNADRNSIYILDVIDDYTYNADEFRQQLDMCDGDLTIYISSPGGSVFLGNTIANLIIEHKKKKKVKVKCIVQGLSASIATQIMLSTDEVVAYPNSLIMIHRASCGCYGNAEEILSQIEILEKIDKVLAQIYADKTGLTIDECLDLMKNETWFTANEALEIGLIDSIVEEELEMVACANIDNLKFKDTSKLEELINSIQDIKKEHELRNKITELRSWLEGL